MSSILSSQNIIQLVTYQSVEEISLLFMQAFDQVQILVPIYYSNSCGFVHDCGGKGTAKPQLLQRAIYRMLTAQKQVSIID